MTSRIGPKKAHSDLAATAARIDLPSLDLIQAQARWLAPARSWLLQRASLARRRAVLDLGSGYGAVTPELLLPGRQVVALDHNAAALGSSLLSPVAGPTCADATRLPFADGSFDLVFCQLALLWMPLEATLTEIRRVLQPGGALVAIEPDYGGMIEYPPKIATRDLWIAALQRAGADPYVGRKLPGLLARQGLEVSVELMSTMTPPARERFDLLRDLGLTDAEREALWAAQRRAGALPGPWEQIAHLPFMLIMASLEPAASRRASPLRRLFGRGDSG